MTTDPIEVALGVAHIFDRLRVPYAISGSLASSVHGETRATQDVDFVAALRPGHLDAFLAALGTDYYADRAAIGAAVDACGSFNVIHLGTMFKVDVFVASDAPADRTQLERADTLAIRADGTGPARVVTAEDIVVRKLAWFRSGGEVSDRQWRDVQGLLRVQGARLDAGYLERAAGHLGVRDLLDRARRAAQDRGQPDRRAEPST